MKDIDFENFEVEVARANVIRTHVELLKDKDLMGDFRLVCTELGFEYKDELGQQALPGMGRALKEQIYEVCDLNLRSEIRLESNANDLKVFCDQKIVCEVSFLPKDKEFVVTYVDDEAWQRLSSQEDSLINNLIAQARKLKNERQKLWKARFSNSKKKKK